MFWEILLFFLVSALLSMVGIGGGIFYVPLFLLLGYDFHTAATTSLFLITLTGFSAFLRYRKAGMVDWKLAVVLETFTDIGAFTGGLTAIHFHPRLLMSLLGILLLIAARFTLKTTVYSNETMQIKPRFGHWIRNFNGYTYSLNLFSVIPLTFVIGYFAGLLGIAGGVFKVPVMILWFGIPVKVAVATSALMVSLTGLLGMSGHLVHTAIDWGNAAILGVAVFAGGQLGSLFSVNLPAQRVKQVLSLVLVLIGIYMLLKNFLF